MMRGLPTVWKWVLGVLVLLNIISLALLWMRPSPPGGPPGSPERMAAFFQKKLALEDEQKDAFTFLISKHRAAARKMQVAKRSAKDQMFEAMTATPQDSALVASLAGKAAAIDIEMDILLANHFRDLQAICKGDQQEKLSQIFQASVPKPPPPGKRPN